jgi:hypothetical protein
MNTLMQPVVIPSAARNPSSFSLPRGLGRRAILFSALLCALCVSVFSSPLFAQSCALCYESARNSSNPAAIDRGILVLLLPTLLLFVGVLVFTIRRSYSRSDTL